LKHGGEEEEEKGGFGELDRHEGEKEGGQERRGELGDGSEYVASDANNE
jgi:hypothetical protein